jgi:hypothetical protein
MRLEPGKYRAVTQTTVSEYHHGSKRSYSIYKPGEIFEIRRGVNGFWWGIEDDWEDPLTGEILPGDLVEKVEE